MEDAHHSTSFLHHPEAAPKTMPLRGKATPNASPSSDLGDPDLGFCLEQHEWVDDSCDRDAFIKVATHHIIARHDQSPSSLYSSNIQKRFSSLLW
jgi:hypothetical protein